MLYFYIDREKFAKRREQAGLSQQQVATRLRFSQKALSDFENGKKPVNQSQVKQLSIILGCLPFEIVSFSDMPRRKPGGLANIGKDSGKTTVNKLVSSSLYINETEEDRPYDYLIFSEIKNSFELEQILHKLRMTGCELIPAVYDIKFAISNTTPFMEQFEIKGATESFDPLIVFKKGLEHVLAERESIWQFAQNVSPFFSDVEKLVGQRKLQERNSIQFFSLIKNILSVKARIHIGTLSWAFQRSVIVNGRPEYLTEIVRELRVILTGLSEVFVLISQKSCPNFPIEKMERKMADKVSKLSRRNPNFSIKLMTADESASFANHAYRADWEPLPQDMAKFGGWENLLEPAGSVDPKYTESYDWFMNISKKEVEMK